MAFHIRLRGRACLHPQRALWQQSHVARPRLRSAVPGAYALPRRRAGVEERLARVEALDLAQNVFQGGVWGTLRWVAQPCTLPILNEPNAQNTFRAACGTWFRWMPLPRWWTCSCNAQ